jgi:hypothetical protein
MSTGIQLAAAVASTAMFFFVYFGITNTSDFKKQPQEKQLAGKKRLKTFLIICFVIGLYKLFSSSTNP